MQNIVYILGAGFSKPLGLPLMGEFWAKSKEMIRSDTQKYGELKEIVEMMNNTGRTANYFSYEPFNIEEALSILELREGRDNAAMLELIKKYIIAVIKYCTPPIPSFNPRPLPANWTGVIFGENSMYGQYGHFVANLFNLELITERIDDYGSRKDIVKFRQKEQTDFNYSIISLNYDMVLENVCNYVNANFKPLGTNLHFDDGRTIETPALGRPCLAKIHGSVEDGQVIPPTYNKGLFQPELPHSWKFAYTLLMKANQIRIVGYSLPQTDAYIKYLLKAAISDAMELERIDVVCLDPEKSVEAKYREFIKFRDWKFMDDRVEDYLGFIFSHVSNSQPGDRFVFNTLEKSHDQFRNRHNR